MGLTIYAKVFPRLQGNLLQWSSYMEEILVAPFDTEIRGTEERVTTQPADGERSGRSRSRPLVSPAHFVFSVL